MSQLNYTPINNQIKKQFLSKTSLPKEVEPIMNREINIGESIEYVPKKELALFVQKNEEIISLPPELKKLGLQAHPSGQLPDHKDIKLMISDDKIFVGLHSSPAQSLRWLAALATYTLHQAHLGLKRVHGHVIRVFRK